MKTNKLLFVSAAFLMMISCDNNYLYSENIVKTHNLEHTVYDANQYEHPELLDKWARHHHAFSN